MSKAEKHKLKGKVKSTFGKEIERKDEAFVLFYAPWCPFSKQFLPVFEEYANSNPEECMSIIVDDKPELCEEYSIEYYPTIILFKKGKVHKRLDATPGVGLNRRQFEELAKNP